MKASIVSVLRINTNTFCKFRWRNGSCVIVTYNTSIENSVKQNRQWTYNVTLRGVLATNVPVENNNYYIFWVWVYSLRSPGRNAPAPYCRMWLDLLYNDFSLSQKGTIFEKKKQFWSYNASFDFLYICQKRFSF